MIQFIKKIYYVFRYRKELNKHIQQSVYKDNLYSLHWLIENHENLMNLLPATYTHEDNLDFVQFGFSLSLLGVHFENKEDLEEIILYLESLNLLNRKNEFLIVRNPFNKFGEGYRKMLDNS